MVYKKEQKSTRTLTILFNLKQTLCSVFNSLTGLNLCYKQKIINLLEQTNI